MNRGIPKKLRRRSTVTDFYVESHSVRNDRCLFPKVWDHIGTGLNGTASRNLKVSLFN